MCWEILEHVGGNFLGKMWFYYTCSEATRAQPGALGLKIPLYYFTVICIFWENHKPGCYFWGHM